MLKKVLPFIAILISLPFFANATQEEAETLERQMWEYIKNHNWEGLDSRIAPFFQAGQFDGFRNKEQYINRAKTLNLTDFTISDFTVTEGPETMIVTYNITAAETIGGKRLSTKAGRLSVWQRYHNNWQWIAHAILIPVPIGNGSK